MVDVSDSYLYYNSIENSEYNLISVDLTSIESRFRYVHIVYYFRTDDQRYLRFFY